MANLLKDNNEINISLKIIDTGLKLNSRNTLLYKEKIKILYEIQRFSNCIDLLEKKEKKIMKILLYYFDAIYIQIILKRLMRHYLNINSQMITMIS